MYFNANVSQVNDALRKHVDLPQPLHEVVVRPGPGMAYSFNMQKRIAFNLELEIMGGVSSHLTKLDRSAYVWSKHPILSVYVNGPEELMQLRIPDGVTLWGLAYVEKRCRWGLASTDRTVRGWGCGVLARLNPYSNDNLWAIANMLKDEDKWVRLNAAGALATFGKTAETVLPIIKDGLDSQDIKTKARLEETITHIEAAQDVSEKAKAHSQILLQIRQWRESNEGSGRPSD